MRKFKSFLRGLGLVAIVIAGLVVWSRLPWPAVLLLVLLLALWLVLTRRGRQTLSITSVGISTLRQRIGASLVVVVGIAGEVGVLVAMLAMGEGFQSTLQQTGSDDTAIVLRGGSNAELNSVLDRDSVNVVIQAPGVARSADGKPVASAEQSVVANLPKRNDASVEANVPIRGVGDEAWTLRPNVKIVQGRRFKPGLRELVVGQGALRQFAGLEVGRQLRLAGQEWSIVGEFTSGDSHDSELWGDAQTVASAYRRGSSVQSVTVRLTSPQAFDAFKAALSSDPRLKVDVTTTREYFSKQSENLTKVIRVVGITVGVIMAIGAIFGALNTMFAAIAARAREIATLRAIGFRGLPVVVSVLMETMLLALLGGVLGVGPLTGLLNGPISATTKVGDFELTLRSAKAWPGRRDIPSFAVKMPTLPLGMLTSGLLMSTS